MILRKNSVKFHSEIDSGKWKNLAHSEATWIEPMVVINSLNIWVKPEPHIRWAYSEAYLCWAY